MAASNYEVEFDARHAISERVLWPGSPAESHGMEDARFVRFTGDGDPVYFATYTAFDGSSVASHLLETADFRTFTISQLRDTYAAALGHPVSATNLQRILTRRGVIEPTSGVSRPASTGGRPATVYRFAARELVVTNPFAAFRPRASA